MLKDLLTVAAASLGSIIVLFLISKMIGSKQISQLNMFDYINGITIGSIAAEMATALETDFIRPLLAMLVYGAAAVLFSYINHKSIRWRRVLEGRAVILLEDGKIYRDNLKKMRLDLNEFLTQCRVQGFFHLGDIELALIEPNGSISILPKSEKRPVIPEDLKLSPDREEVEVNVIMDGKILSENLKHMGKDEGWLEKQLIQQKISKLSDVFLATLTKSNTLSIYVNKNRTTGHDIFQ